MPLFRGMKRWVIIIPVVFLSSLLVAACAGENEPQTILNPAGPIASNELNLFWFILIVATIVFVAVEGWLIFSIIRYRERPNMPQPRQIHGNNTVEIIWTIAPSIFLLAVLAGTIFTMFSLQQPAGPKLEVRAVGHQWWWEFDYLNQHIVTADTLAVPTNTIVQVDLVSNNVIHSFWIPALTGKTDDIPGHDNHLWFKADSDKAGNTYRGACAEYCGTQHAHMNFNVVVYDPNGFNTWVSTQQQAAQTPTGDATVCKTTPIPAADLALCGEQIFKGTGGCTGCHGLVGVDLSSFDAPTTASGLPTSSLVGPNLTHFGSRSYIAGGILEASSGHTWANEPACQIVNGQVADKANCGLYKWLQDPQGVKPGNDMVIGQLSDAQINALVAYLESLQ